MRMMLAAALCGLAGMFATTASAQTVTMQCTFTSADAHTRFNDGAIVSDGAQAGQVSQLFVDFGARTFTLGGTTGNILPEPNRIIAMSRDGAMFGIWEISRQSGQIIAIGAMSDDSMAGFYRTNGQCARADGSTRF